MVAVGIVALGRIRQLASIARSASLLVTVTLTVLLIPLFTADLWLAVARLNPWNFVVFTALSLLPLAITVLRQLSRQVPQAVAAAAASADARHMTELTRDWLVRRIPADEREVEREPVHDVLGALTDERAIEAAASVLPGPITKRLRRSFLLTTLALTGVAAAYLWLLAWTLVPISAVREWTGTDVPTVHVDVPAISF